jgi:hypothetical protein
MGQRGAEPGTKDAKKKLGVGLVKRRGSIRDSVIGSVVVQPDTFRKVAGISSQDLMGGGPAHVTIDLNKKSGDTMGVFLRQGDGFDRASGALLRNEWGGWWCDGRC